MPIDSLLSDLNGIPIMKSNVIGRVKNLKLPKKNVLYPLFEAIINSVDSIEEADGSERGKIEIHINRDRQTDIEFSDDSAKSIPPIMGFTIVDNGVGFNRKNLDSFCTSDSQLKELKGGKGIGRFTWLKAFSGVNISSTFKDNGSYSDLNFDFLLNERPIQNFVISESQARSDRTVVTLKNIIKYGSSPG